jgi:predicted amidohydrolase
MNKNSNVSRRNFIRTTSTGLGAGLVGLSVPACSPAPSSGAGIPARKVSVASVDLKGLWPDSTRESRLKRILGRMQDVTGFKPDLVCMPELFDTSWVEENFLIRDIAEDEKTPGPFTSRIAEFARKNSCYVACPIYTKKDGNYYNSCLILDRKGEIAGVYHKMHPVKDEIITGKEGEEAVGVLPGEKDQPVIVTDFGKLGVQICYDANWQDGWEQYSRQGAEIMLFVSQFPGGRILNYYAWRHGCYIVSSTGGDARIIDMSGNDIHASSTFTRFAWADLNLEKMNTDTWPTNERIPDLFRKYGDRLGIHVWDNTGVITIESFDKDLKVADVLREFGIMTVAENVRTSEEVQNKYRL